MADASRPAEACRAYVKWDVHDPKLTVACFPYLAPSRR